MNKNLLRSMATATLVCMTVFLISCAGETVAETFQQKRAPTPITKEKIATADYGPVPSENYQEIIKAELSKGLIDPTSPIFEIGRPMMGYIRESSYFGSFEDFGWQVCGTINSKNRYGGYAGPARFVVLMHGDKISQKFIGSSMEITPQEGLLNFAIHDVCYQRQPDSLL